MQRIAKIIPFIEIVTHNKIAPQHMGCWRLQTWMKTHTGPHLQTTRLGIKDVGNWSQPVIKDILHKTQQLCDSLFSPLQHRPESCSQFLFMLTEANITQVQRTLSSPDAPPKSCHNREMETSLSFGWNWLTPKILGYTQTCKVALVYRLPILEQKNLESTLVHTKGLIVVMDSGFFL